MFGQLGRRLVHEVFWKESSIGFIRLGVIRVFESGANGGGSVRVFEGCVSFDCLLALCGLMNRVNAKKKVVGNMLDCLDNHYAIGI